MDSFLAAQFIKQEAKKLGFTSVGISRAEKLEKEAIDLETWLNKGHHGKMAYMENHFDKRVDPSKLVPGAKSVISLLFNYYSSKKQTDDEAPKVSTYAFGKDYHFVVKDKLKELFKHITDQFGDIEGRVFVDSAPVLERALAAKSGLGWMGKNTMLITREQGSYFFLAEIILDLELQPDEPIADYCGTCTKCIDACPTDAIIKPYWVDGSKCISYFTIELKDEIIPKSVKGQFENWAFGCDICQEVCPWNRFSKEHNEPQFIPKEEFLNLEKSEWLEMTEEIYRELFRHTPLKRAKFKGIKRNVDFLYKD